MSKRKLFLWIALMLFCNGVAQAEETTCVAQAGETTNQPVLHFIGYSHLDTQWRWTYVETIKDYLPDTLHDNFELFEKYPHYMLNFSGANRYQMMKEYYPDDYIKMHEYIAQGRWFPCGNSWEESDVNVPSSESLIRQVLYGYHYFKKEFGTESAEFMLPDCFGFPASLPSILAHCGIKGFSTQKLTWESAVGIPFDLGKWQGPDGNSVIAAFDPGRYNSRVTNDLSWDQDWLQKCEDLGRQSGLYAAYGYYGTGDRGGAPLETSVENVGISMTSDGPLKVVSGRADQLFNEITAEQEERLSVYSGDLLLIKHSAGSITSQGYMKRWNRMNEVLADAAEKASVAANLTSAAPYPQDRLNKAWGLVLGGQFHDILPGTSDPEVYEYSQNDEVIALNSFASVLTEGVSAISRGLDTQVEGIPLVVFNPLSIEREDPVEITIPLSDKDGVQVMDAAGNPVLTQILERKDGQARVLFLARVPSVGVAVFSAVAGPYTNESAWRLRAEDNVIQNGRYRVTVNEAGDIESIYDKTLFRDLLESPARLVLTYEKPEKFAAWNMDWEDRQKPPMAYAGGPAKIRIVEEGPVRVAIEVTREVDNSTIVQTIRLSNGTAGDRIEVACEVDWQTRERALRAEFPLTVSNPMATYNWELGKIERGNNEPTKYEVPMHGWMDLTDTNKTYGVSIFSDTKYGSDKPADNVLRLTLLYTPGAEDRFGQQRSQDWGRHEFLYGIAGHPNDWRSKSVSSDWTAMRMSQPMPVFQASKHPGMLGRSFSLIHTTGDQVAVQAIKKAENSDRVILRLQELRGEAVRGMGVSMATGIVAANEVNGVETVLNAVPVTDGKLTLDFTPYQIRSLALTLKPFEKQLKPALSWPVALPYDTDVFSRNGETVAAGHGFDAEGRAIPAEMIGDTVTLGDVSFKIGPRDNDQLNAVTCRKQKIDLPTGDWNRIYILAAAADGDVDGKFVMGRQTVPLRIQNWGGFIGQWDTRVFDPDSDLDVVALKSRFIKRDPLAWFCSHRHLKDGYDDEPYAYSYLFMYAIDIPEGSTTLTLPQNEKIRVVAASVSRNGTDVVVPAHPLYDDFTGEPNVKFRAMKESGAE